MPIRIIKPGLFSTIQDLGREGYQSAGIPVSGAMDRYSIRMANLLCGNPVGAAVLETAWHGAQWIAESRTLIAFSGGGARLFINEKPVPAGRPVLVPAYALMTLEPASGGFYSYLAVAGGFCAQEQMSSASTFIPSGLGGIQGRALQAGDLLETSGHRTELSVRIELALQTPEQTCTYPAWSLETAQDATPVRKIRAMEGPEFEWFDNHAGSAFWREIFSVSVQSNRMATRLQGKRMLVHEKRELLSTAVTRGTIQVTHDGTLLVLMADAQTMGGYPRIAQVAAVDLHRLAQVRPGETIQFIRISREQAEELYLEEERKLRQLETNIAMRYGL
jgi:antagonist of KipI